MIVAGTALAAIIAVQFYLISGLYRLRTREFDNTYQKEIKKGMELLQVKYHTTGFDSAYAMIDYVSMNILKQYTINPGDSSRNSLDKQTLSFIFHILRRYDMVTPFLKAYFQVNGMDDDFREYIQIRSFTLLNPGGDIHIAGDTTAGTVTKYKKRSLYYVNSFRSEGNFYKLYFDYYIDFTHKARIIFRDMLGSMLLSLLSILITAIIFFITLHNMLKYKQLSMIKTDFINNMAHELKTPLTTIAVAASTLGEPAIRKDPGKTDSLVSLIRQQNQHLGKLIDHILDINLWEQEQIIPKKKYVRLKEFLTKILEAFRLENKDMAFKLEENLDLNEEQAYLDEFQFSIAIHNLLSNALKYGGNPPVIGFRASVRNQSLTIQITDNGHGISGKDKDHIFEKFFRGRNTQHRVKGLGLGLYYVKKILEMHHGTVTLENSSENGSSFIITVPL